MCNFKIRSFACLLSLRSEIDPLSGVNLEAIASGNDAVSRTYDGPSVGLSLSTDEGGDDNDIDTRS